MQQGVDHRLVGHIAPLRLEPPHVVRIFAIAACSACIWHPAQRALARRETPPGGRRAWATGAPPAKPCSPAPCVRPYSRGIQGHAMHFVY